jgi:magnesium transporter
MGRIGNPYDVVGTRRPHPGAPPGTLIADPDAVQPTFRIIAYDRDRLVEEEVPNLEALNDLVDRFPVSWIDIDGLADIDAIRWFGERFNIHGLALEDVVNVHQRPKVEHYDDQTYLVTRMPVAGEVLKTEQVSIFLGRGYVLTFQERPGDCFEPVRERLRKGSGRIRTNGEDYLAYALLDAVIDSYYPVLEAHGERMERLEEEILERPDPGLIAEIHSLKRDFLTFRRSIWPQREMINAIIRDTPARITESTVVYLRDSYDHTVQLLDMVETYREIASGLVDLHFSSVSTRMNETMKVLTIIATIFIPLSLIAGVYGMNFDASKSPLNMPELGWYFGYPFALGLMVLVAGVLLYFFYRRGWIGARYERKSGTAFRRDG